MPTTRNIGITDRLHVTVPLAIYSVTAFMFFPLLQSLIFNKVCEESKQQYDEQLIGIDLNTTTIINCTNQSEISSNYQLQTRANHLHLLWFVFVIIIGNQLYVSVL
jgi:hypothetical protein